MPDLSKRPERYATAGVVVVAALAFSYFALGLRLTTNSSHASTNDAAPIARPDPTVTVTAPVSQKSSQKSMPSKRNCSEFPNQEAAQAFWNTHRAEYASWDGNHNGVVCEQLKTVTTSYSGGQAAAVTTKIVQRNVLLSRTEPSVPKTQSITTATTKPTAPSKAKILATKNLFGLYAATADQYTGVESSLSRTANIHGYFQGWDTGFRAGNVNAAWTAGQLPFLTWESRPLAGGSTSVDYSLTNIASGKFDAYLKKYAQAIVTNGLPLMIRFDQEMNGNWYRWAETDPDFLEAAGSYVAAWRHVHDIFQAAGANRLVIWDWSPNRVDNIGAAGRDLTRYYPGDAYVDVAGMTGYYRPGDQAPTFDSTYDATLSLLRQVAPGKPIMLSEVGATEYGGNKVNFVNSFFQGLAANPDIFGFAWFDYTVTSTQNGVVMSNDWRIESTTPVLNAFRTGMLAADWGLPTGRRPRWGTGVVSGVSTAATSTATPTPTASSTSTPNSTSTAGPAATSNLTSSPTSTSATTSTSTPTS